MARSQANLARDRGHLCNKTCYNIMNLEDKNTFDGVVTLQVLSGLEPIKISIPNNKKLLYNEKKPWI